MSLLPDPAGEDVALLGDNSPPETELEAFGVAVKGIKDSGDLEEAFHKEYDHLVDLRRTHLPDELVDFDENEQCKFHQLKMCVVIKECRTRGERRRANSLILQLMKQKRFQYQEAEGYIHRAMILGDDDCESLKAKENAVQTKMKMTEQEITRIEGATQRNLDRQGENLRSKYAEVHVKIDQRLTYTFIAQSFLVGAVAVNLQTVENRTRDCLEVGLVAKIMYIILPILGLFLSTMSLVILFPQFEILEDLHKALRMVEARERKDATFMLGRDDRRQVPEARGRQCTRWAYRCVLLGFAFAWVIIFIGSVVEFGRMETMCSGEPSSLLTHSPSVLPSIEPSVSPTAMPSLRP